VSDSQTWKGRDLTTSRYNPTFEEWEDTELADLSKVLAWVAREHPAELVAAVKQLAVDAFDVVESEPRQGRHGEWEQQEPHIVSGKIESAPRCLLPTGSYLVVPVSASEEPTQ
jgi:hypothetical protein